MPRPSNDLQQCTATLIDITIASTERLPRPAILR